MQCYLAVSGINTQSLITIKLVYKLPIRALRSEKFEKMLNLTKKKGNANQNQQNDILKCYKLKKLSNFKGGETNL